MKLHTLLVGALLAFIPSTAEACEVGCTRDLQRYDSPRVAVQHSDPLRVSHRPPGCPKKYCGCALSKRLFGRVIPALNLAYNWVRMFPRTSPAPQMIAARHGHVMQLQHHIAGSVWFVHDPNSGQGLTRDHARSISGFVIVNPYGARLATNQRRP